MQLDPTDEGKTLRRWLLLALAGGVLVLVGTIVAVATLLWGKWTGQPPDPTTVAERIQRAERFANVHLTDAGGGTYHGQAAAPDGTLFDLTATVRPDGYVDYFARSRAKDADRQRVEQIPSSHLGVQPDSFDWKGDGWLEGTATTPAGERCRFTLKRQAQAPFPDGVAYDCQVCWDSGREWSAVVQLNVDVKTLQGSFRW